MKKVRFYQSIHMKFVLIYVLLILIAMEIMGYYFSHQLQNSLEKNFTEQVKSHTKFVTYNLEEVMNDPSDIEENEAKIHQILVNTVSGGGDITEIRAINTNNTIIGTSDSNNQGMVGFVNTDNIVQQVISNHVSSEKISVDSTGKRVWVRVEPIEIKDKVLGYIYVIANIESVYNQVDFINKILASGTIAAILITAVLGIILGRMVSKPISNMRRQAMAMARGNFSHKVKVNSNDEIGQLAHSFNFMTKKLQEAQALTEGEQRKLSSILSYMTDGVIATDRRGRIILINGAAEEMLDVSRETVLSVPLVDVINVEQSFEDLLSQQDSMTLDYSTDDTPLIMRVNFSVIQNETGFVSGLTAVLHDVTEQEKIDQERREFVANVSHELRTPLTSMRSYLEALADGAWKDEDIAPRFLSVTQDETERLIRLVNDLLKLSKMDSKDQKLNKEPVNFVKFMSHIVDRFEMTQPKHITFKRKLLNDSIFVDVDEDKMTQVLFNIISNAIKYSPEGGQITIRMKDYTDRVEVSIADQGVGIPKENLKKIFERFYRVDKARTRKLGGTGLGLAIAKEMIAEHGGRIWARSQEGKGTTIYFELPYDRSQEDDWS